MSAADHIDSPHLGQSTTYPTHYDASLLFPISRQTNRDLIQVAAPLPFYGYDTWNAYEVSWLDQHGKPVVAVGQFIVPCDSPFLVESKSMKLYLNSLNNQRFDNTTAVIKTISQDLNAAFQKEVTIHITPLHELTNPSFQQLDGFCLDQLTIKPQQYNIDPSLLCCEEEIVEETLFSNLLKSNCPVTNQPDWGSVYIHYQGQKINHDSLLKYIISYREHNGFAEHCVEEIFAHLQAQCQPSALTVLTCNTRRGGIDISPCRSTDAAIKPNLLRLVRQ